MPQFNATKSKSAKVKAGIKDGECFPEDFAFSDACTDLFDLSTDEWQFDRTKVLRAHCCDSA